MNAIETTELTKQFGDIRAVDSLNLSIKSGEIFGFLGPNGAGKSTTIDILLDFVRPTAGDVSVLGYDAQDESLDVRRRTGVLPDAYHVYDRLTGKQHVELAIRMKESTDTAEDLLERVGIPEAAERRAGGYSKGMRQRMALAMALVGSPELLILDEPSTGLDPNGAREMREIILEENDRGATVFFSSHIMEQVEAVCDRVGIINHGSLVAVDSVEALRDTSRTGETLVIIPADSSDTIRDHVASLPEVQEAILEDGKLRIRVDEMTKLDVLWTIHTDITPIEDFTIVRSSLEDLFLQFTADAPGVQT